MYNQLFVFLLSFRKCGRVVCKCSTTKTTYLPSTYVVCPPSQKYLESPHISHRTCDKCVEELDIIRYTLRDRTSKRFCSNNVRLSHTTYLPNYTNYPRGNSSQNFGFPTQGRGGNSCHIHSDSMPVRSDCQIPPIAEKSGNNTFPIVDSVRINSEKYTKDDLNSCNICPCRLASPSNLSDCEHHISQCLKSPKICCFPPLSPLRANRLIVYCILTKEVKDLKECLICFEEFKSLDSVAQLECLCNYHEKCILSWFSQNGAGACPVHVING